MLNFNKKKGFTQNGSQVSMRTPTSASLGMTKFDQGKTRGFTLIELLVVIAIIAILSSVVFASLSVARQKSRDARRVSDIEQLRTALEIYFDSNSTYATSAAFQYWNLTAPLGGIASTTPVAIAKIPLSSQSNFDYYYCAMLTASSTTCDGTGVVASAYVIGADLERTDNQSLKTDADKTVGTVFYGADTASCQNNANGSQGYCFDVAN